MRHHDEQLEQAAARFLLDVALLTGRDTDPAAQGMPLQIACGGATLGSDEASEAYNLTVGPAGVLLDAREPVGVLRGLATLRQLLTPAGEGYALPQVKIEDAPRFASTPWTPQFTPSPVPVSE